MRDFVKTNANNKIFLKTNTFLNLNVLWIINSSSDKNSLFDLILEFYSIWPPFQWVTSLLTLIVTYWISGYYYNKFLAKKNCGWMDWKTRSIMILVDLFLNFSLGIYYMNYRNTFIGTLTLKCPIFWSPLFWILELVCFYVYYRYFTDLKKKI